MNQIESLSGALLTSLAAAMAALFVALPKMLAFVGVLLIGWFLASLIAKAVAAVLRSVRFDQLAERAGLSGFVENLGVDSDASGWIAALAKWFIRLIALVVAFDALGLPAVSQVLRELLLWLPNLIVAMVVLVIAGLAAGALSNLVRAATAQAGFSNPEMLAKVTAMAVWVFAVVIAVNQIGVAATLVNTLWMGTVGAVSLAVGLSFGLGGREVAGQLVKQWKDSAEAAKPKIERATEIVKSDVQRSEKTMT